MHRRGSPFEHFRRFDVRIADDEVGKGVHLALNDGDVSAGEFGVDDCCSHRTAVAEVAGNQALNAAHAAIDENRIEIEAMLLENARLLSDPINHRRIGRIGDIGNVACSVGGAITRRQSDECENNEPAYSKFHDVTSYGNLAPATRPRFISSFPLSTRGCRRMSYFNLSQFFAVRIIPTAQGTAAVTYIQW